MTDAQKVAKRFLEHVGPLNPGPAISAAMNGTLDSFIARETVKRLEGKETITFGDIRKANREIFEGAQK